MIQDFLQRAQSGESVFLADVRAAFARTPRVACVVETALGMRRQYTLAFPVAQNAAETEFIREYFYACIYNLISALGGKYMRLYVRPEDAEAYELCASLDDVFQTGLARKDRFGYGKCLNVTDRVNAAMGCRPFYFEILRESCPPIPAQRPGTADALSVFRAAVQNAGQARLCGMDIGGTDVKVVGIRDGHIAAVKEYDWNPAALTDMDALLTPILLLTRVMRVALSLPDLPEAEALRAAMLDKNATEAQMRTALDEAEHRFGVAQMLDGVGVCFPDVVIKDKIVGGETLKTRGIRAHAADYEGEFRRLAELKLLLSGHCRPGGAVHMANDGSLAAYTAAVELAHSDAAAEVMQGVFAHTLGTELGTGWIDETGAIPQIPLEIYNCIIDLGDYPARVYDQQDLRSVNNFNTGLPGTLQKYGSQSGAYRLALQYFQSDPALYATLFSEGFIEEREGGVFVRTTPADMRKPLLERIMTMAEEGEPAAEAVFREIGRYLALTWEETEFILAPQTRPRVLFGRFIKHRRCFELMQEGAAQRLPLRLIAGDGTLAYTPLMLDLKADPAHTVAQFGQAVGAAYFAASVLEKECAEK